MKLTFSGFKGELSGGISAAIVSLPLNALYGAIAFAPLGKEHLADGILAGMFSSIFAGFFTAIFSAKKTPIVPGPQPSSSIVLSSAIGQLMAAGLLGRH